MKPGKSLEKLVENLEKVLAGKGNLTIESPKRLVDKTTGRLREFDVLLTIKQQHHEVLIGFECRDRSRPITVNQVEGFWKKCQDTGIAQGIMVSSNGFCATATMKAEHLGIRCLNVEEVSSFNWLLTKGMVVYKRNIKHIHYTYNPAENFNPKPTDFSLVNKDGDIVSQDILLGNVQQRLFDSAIHGDEGIYKETFLFRGDGVVFLKDNSTGHSYPIITVVAVCEYEVTTEFAPFELIKYFDKTTGDEITDAAIASVKVDGSFTGKVMIAYKESEGGKIALIPDKQI